MENTNSLKYTSLPNNETYAYRDAGSSKDVIVLVHGNLSSSFYYEPLIQKLVGNYRVVAPDLRGYGHSTSNKTTDSIDDLVEDLKLFVDNLQLKNFVLAGWSLGGGLVMKFAARYPDYVLKLVLLHSIGIKGFPAYLIDEKGNQIETRAKTMEDIKSIPERVELNTALLEKDRAKIEKRIMATFFNGSKQPSKEELNAYTDETMLQKSALIASHILNIYNISSENNNINDGTGEYLKIKCGVLVVGGEKDKPCPAEGQLKLKEDLGERASVKIFEDCGHYSVGDHLEELTQIILDFIKSAN